MRRILGYLVVTTLFIVSGVGALLYVRGGDAPETHLWTGGEIRVGYSGEPPYCFRTATGEVSGAAPEVAKAVFGHAGIGPVRWVLLDFNQAIPALLDGRIDMIANGLFITPERAKRMLFSRPFCRSLQGLLVRRGNPLDLHSYEEAAKSPAARIAVLDGSVEQLALASLGTSPERLFVVPDPAGGLAAVRSGRADALALSAPTVAWLAGESQGEAEPASPMRQAAGTPEGQSAFAFRPADAALAGRVDAALAGYIGSKAYLDLLTSLGFASGLMSAGSR
ncbi:transporter substrate-binding domain-containing protein [Solidesulfovibrio sp.]|uniref:transporter substrate-binding domain-containing protein n=1 Tax=Solidesulfovibrio sp. TaxID=2910990 RepID=UPI00261B71A9|nr:transporter substrate-binding domain-containing protein [Solidesulfovibrio sp.]